MGGAAWRPTRFHHAPLRASTGVVDGGVGWQDKTGTTASPPSGDETTVACKVGEGAHRYFRSVSLF